MADLHEAAALGAMERVVFDRVHRSALTDEELASAIDAALQVSEISPKAAVYGAWHRLLVLLAEVNTGRQPDAAWQWEGPAGKPGGWDAVDGAARPLRCHGRGVCHVPRCRTSWNIYDTVANGAAKVRSVCATHQVDSSDVGQIDGLRDKTRELASRPFASSRGWGGSYPMPDAYHETRPGY